MMGRPSTSRSTIVSRSSFIALLLLARTRHHHAAFSRYRLNPSCQYLSCPYGRAGSGPHAPDGGTVFSLYLRTEQISQALGAASAGRGADQRPATAPPRSSSTGCAAPQGRRYWRRGRESRPRGSHTVTVSCRIKATSSRIELSVVQCL